MPKGTVQQTAATAGDPLAVLRAYDDAALTQFALPASLERGRTYARRRAVHEVAVDGNVVTGTVRGTEPEPYRATLVVTGDRIQPSSRKGTSVVVSAGA